MKIKNISGWEDSDFVTLFELTFFQYDNNYRFLTIFCLTVLTFDIGFGLDYEE